MNMWDPHRNNFLNNYDPTHDHSRPLPGQFHVAVTPVGINALRFGPPLRDGYIPVNLDLLQADLCQEAYARDGLIAACIRMSVPSIPYFMRDHPLSLFVYTITYTLAIPKDVMICWTGPLLDHASGPSIIQPNDIPSSEKYRYENAIESIPIGILYGSKCTITKEEFVFIFDPKHPEGYTSIDVNEVDCPRDYSHVTDEGSVATAPN